MTEQPTTSSVLDQMRTALTEIESPMFGGGTVVNAVPASLYTQEDYPYWTNTINLTSTARVGTSEWVFTYTIQAVCHLAPATAGIDQELEIRAQNMASIASIAFSRRNLLHCDTYPNGVVGAQGLTVQNALQRITGQAGSQTRVILITLSVPVLYQFDTF